MRFEAFEFLVMLFYLMDAPPTFCSLINKVLEPFLDLFTVAYLNNIGVYNQSLDEQIKHLFQMVVTLWYNSVSKKMENCAFNQAKIPFLDHIIRHEEFK